MIQFRAVTLDDLDGLISLVRETDTGMTTLPKNDLLLEQRLFESVDAFANPNPEKQSFYWFVLEDIIKKRIVGCAGIETKLGLTCPFYSYEIITQTRQSEHLHYHTEDELLMFGNPHHGKSELCSLYLSKPYRKYRLGPFLSRARLLFIKQYPELFSSSLIADMRGFTDEKGKIPFWNALGKHFFPISFEKADMLTLITQKQIITDLMPRYPIYIRLLPKSVQKLIGVPHPDTMPAYHILCQEGFSFSRTVDIFDAGPTLEGHIPHLFTVQHSEKRIVSHFSVPTDTNFWEDESLFIISNAKGNFKAAPGSMDISPDNLSCGITEETAKLIECKIGDHIYFSPLSYKLRDPVHAKPEEIE